MQIVKDIHDSCHLTPCQTNSSDGTVYDDNDGKGCTTVDEADKKAAPSATVYADGHYDLVTESQNAQTNQYVTNWLQTQAPQYPTQISPQGQQLLKELGKDTAGVPTVCSVGAYGQLGGGAGAVGASYDSNSGAKGYGTVRPIPGDIARNISPVSVSVKGDTNGHYSGGVTIRDPATRLGGGISINDQGRPTVSASWAPGPLTVGATTTLGTMGDPKCQPHP